MSLGGKKLHHKHGGRKKKPAQISKNDNQPRKINIQWPNAIHCLGWCWVLFGWQWKYFLLLLFAHLHKILSGFELVTFSHVYHTFFSQRRCHASLWILIWQMTYLWFCIKESRLAINLHFSSAFESRRNELVVVPTIVSKTTKTPVKCSF